MKKKIVLLLCITLAVSLAGLNGCGKKEEPAAVEEKVEEKPEEKVEEKPKVEPEEIPEEEILQAIGVEEEGAYKVKLTNNTGQEIKGVSIKSIEDPEFPENMLVDEDAYKMDETRFLYYKAPEETEDEVAEGDTDERLLTPGYDIQLTFADDSIAVLHAFPFEDLEEGSVCFEDEVAFVKYQSISMKEEVVTKEAEVAIKERAAEEEAERAAADQAAAAEAERAAADRAAQAAAQQAEADQAAADQAAAERAAADQAAAAEAERAAAAAAERAAAEQAAAEAAAAAAAQESNAASDNADGCIGDDGLTY